VKLLLDMNVSPDMVAVIGAHGHDVVHWSAVGDHHAPDASVLSWALSHGRVLVTHDLDFAAILATTRAAGPSVIQIREQDLLSPDLARALVNAIRLAGPALEAGAVITIHHARARIRVLPFLPGASD
jgi:predicted nuclease of predicted toxin-antitoxin system